MKRTPEEQKERRRQYNKAYYAANTDAIKAKVNKWVANNRDKHNIKCSLWAKENNTTESRREVWRKCAYGITTTDYEKMLQDQSGSCALCPEVPGDKPLCIDHDHASGKIRGLLCDRCNRGLGYFRDSVVSLRKAADYIERSYN